MSRPVVKACEPRNEIGGPVDLSASMMCADLADLGTEVQRLEQAGIDSFHFDIMDGHFVPNMALTPAILAALRPLTAKPFVAHLMVENPRDYVKQLADAGANYCVFHIEATRYPRRLVSDITLSGMSAGVAINPATNVCALESVSDVACVLVMSVEPGFAGAEWIGTSPRRVQAIRLLTGERTTIAVDGHIDPTTAAALRTAGADALICGTTSLFGKGHRGDAYAARVRALRESLACLPRGTDT